MAEISSVTTIPHTGLKSMEKGSVLGENLMKWNLDVTLSISKKAFQGNFPNNADKTGVQKALAELLNEKTIEI